MVSVEEIVEDSSDHVVEEEKENNSNETEPEQQRVGTWEKLMGDDLMMMVTSVDDDSSGQQCDVQDAVTVDFIGKRASDKDDTSGTVFHEAKDWMVIIGDKDVCPTLEMGIRFLRQGEHARIFGHSKYAYGPMGRTHGDYKLPPDSNVIYEVHCKRIEQHVSAMQIATSKKIIGNDVYQNEWADGYGKHKALKLYQRAAECLEDAVAQNPQDADAKTLLIDVLNNTAAVLLRAKDYGKAKEAATQVLLQDPDNVKGLCRAARAAMLDPAGTYQESELAILAAEQVAPEDADVKKLRGELTRRKKQYKKKSKELASKMAQGMKKETEQGNTEGQVTETKDPSAANEEQVAKVDEKKWYWRLLPYLIQIILPFITYQVYRYMGGNPLGEEYDRFKREVETISERLEQERLEQQEEF